MSFHRWCFLIATVVYITAAWFGIGYHAEDEFQQVILIAEHLRGNVDTASLPLDYQLRWRSMVQPLLCAAVFNTCEWVGISDPFQLTLALRLLTAALALWVTHGFVRAVQPMVRAENRQAFVLLNCLLWFLPALQIRFTGEAWSGLLFLRGLGMLVDQRERKALVIGAWFGVSVLFRPAAMLMPLGAVLWMLLVQRATYKRVMLVITGVVLVVAVGFAVDSIAYGALTSTLGNYLTAVLTGEEAARFTTLPWYQYPLFVLKYATLPIGSLIILAFALLIALERKHVLVWILLPFLVVHSMIGVKEARFLFPLAPLVPWLLISTWETLQERWPVMMSKAIWLRLLFLFAAVNALALVIGILTPAGNGKIKLAEAIHEHYGDQAVHIDHMGNWREWIPPFFLAPKSTEAFVEKIIVQPKVTGPNHLVMAPASMDLDRIANLERIATGAPGWTAAPMRWYLLEDAPDPLVLYRVHTGVPGH